MKIKHSESGGIRAYIRNSKAWYASGNENVEITIGIYHSSTEGTRGEFSVEWLNIANNELLAPRLCSFDDSWSVLNEFKDLLEKMKELDNQNIQEPEFCKVLDSLNIKDITKYERE